jgi:DNA polymerase/3'-5' exonuclease PolX
MSNLIAKGSWELKEARTIAEEIIERLRSHCHKIDIAGSIRREMSYVGDIEIVAVPIRQPHLIPVYKKVMQPDLMGEETEVKVIDQEKSKTVLRPLPAFISIVQGWVKVKGEPDGRYTQRILPEGIKLDLFMTTVEDYYRIYAIRTGSAEYSMEVIARQWVRRGWRGTKDGLRLTEECKETSSGWQCIVDNPTILPAWQTEEEFFKFINVVYIHPKNRY